MRRRTSGPVVQEQMTRCIRLPAEQLTGPDRTFVRVTFTRIREQLSSFRTSATNVVSATGGVALGAASNFLGGLVAAAFAEPDGDPGDGFRAGASGAGGRRGTGSGGGRGQGSTRSARADHDRVRVSASTEPRVEERDGRVVVVQRFSVDGPGTVELTAQLSVATPDGREDDAPADAARPTVRSWLTPDGEVDDNRCTVTPPTEVELVIVPVPDTVTDIAVVGIAVAEQVS